MPLSIFVLALWFFLQSSAQLGWFAVDPKLLAWVGLAFVIAVLIEAWFVGYRGRQLLPLRAFKRREQ
jgi:hypothetical protein